MEIEVGLSLTKNFPNMPGVYQMFDRKGRLLYVGKAKNLSKRVSSYFKKHDHPRLNALVSHVDKIEFTVVNSEKDALILENRLIKEGQPKYNVLLKDGKGYPYIVLTDHVYPQILCQRSDKKEAQKGEWFGPFPSIQAAHHVTDLLRKEYQVRSCSDSFFAHRSRPCLEYQIHRCMAPCVKKNQDEKYSGAVSTIRDILSGKDHQLVASYQDKMKKASSDLEFELAARYRDQVSSIRTIQSAIGSEQQEGDMDIFAFSVCDMLNVVVVLHVRGGQILSSRTYEVDHIQNSETSLAFSFLTQYQHQGQRLTHSVFILGQTISAEEHEALVEISKDLSPLVKQKRLWVVSEKVPPHQSAILNIAFTTAQTALKTKIADQERQIKIWQEISSLFKDQLYKKDHLIESIECYDISHTQGEEAVASRVRFVHGYAEKRNYRHYPISGIQPGDDYHALEKAIEHRINSKTPWPDLFLIDGGWGQAQRVYNVLCSKKKDNKIDHVPLVVGIYKSEGRISGKENLVVPATKLEIDGLENPLALMGLIQIRDEAHRFALLHHRRKRDHKRKNSILEKIKGIGTKHRQALLNYFGGLDSLKKATLEDIEKVPGLGPKKSKDVWLFFHAEK